MVSLSLGNWGPDSRTWRTSIGGRHLGSPDSGPLREKRILPRTNETRGSIMLGPIVLKYQSKPDTLFPQYAVYFWCSLVSTCIYWMLLQPIRHMLQEADAHRWFQILTRIEPPFALLSVLTLLSVLLPHHIAWVPLILWTLVPMVLAWPLYCCIYTWARLGIGNIIVWVPGFSEFGGGNSAEAPGGSNSTFTTAGSLV